MKITTKPCNNCPYRKDAPLKLWSIEEFIDLMKKDNEPFSPVYGCHKNNGCICAGWLTDQDRRRFPNIMLRLLLSRQGTTRKILDKLEDNYKIMYSSIRQMAIKNYSKLKSLNFKNVNETKDRNNHSR